MKYYDKCISLFSRAICDLNYNNVNNESRKLDEIDYIRAYLIFINNSIHYSRFTCSIKDITITGKYLNQKVNKWSNAGIFKKIHEYAITNYKKTHKYTKHVYIDGHIVTNRYASNNVGRCVYYKSKNGYNLQTIVDDNGIGLGFMIKKASTSETKMLIDTFNCSVIENGTKYIKSKKYKMYFIADAGYYTKENCEFLTLKGYIPLIWPNKRNTKNKQILKSNEIK